MVLSYSSSSNNFSLNNNTSFYPTTPADISGCVGYWNFNTSGTFVQPIIGSSTGSVLGNLIFTDGRVGSCYYNPGSTNGNNIVIENPSDYSYSLAKTTTNQSGISNGLLSISYWQKLSSLGSMSSYGHILGKSSSSLGHEWVARIQNWGTSGTSNFIFFGNPDGATSVGISNYGMMTDKWYHCVFIGSKVSPDNPTVSGLTMWVYINGNLIGSTYKGNYTQPLGPNRNEPVRVYMRGADSRSNPGHVDELAIYNKVLSPQEVTQLYNLGYTKFNTFNSTTNNLTLSGANNFTLKNSENNIILQGGGQ